MPDTHQTDDHRDHELDAQSLFDGHRRTGEPLTDSELDAVVRAGLAGRHDFDMRGGHLWWHRPTFPDPDCED